MDELGAILKAWRRMRENPGSAVLATVVHVEGSAYRRPGARMLICGDGNCVGSISGGCLEGDVTKKAAWWTADGKAVLRVYDTSSEEAAWEFGLGCNGVITLMLERVASPAVGEALAWIDAHRAERRNCAVAVVIRADQGCGVTPGDRLLWEEGSTGGALAVSPFSEELTTAAAAACRERCSRLVHLACADVFVEYLGAPQRLVIFGAGHDAIPLAAAAVLMGWSVMVADGRPTYARESRFPGAERVVVLPADASLAALEFGEDSAVVMMTHNFPQDERLLPQILARSPRYLGMLGPRRRAELLFEAIGESITAREVHAPAGLDIGGDAPAATALSIAAEAQAVLEGRTGGPLKWRRGPIHNSPRELGREVRASESELAELTACGTNV